MGRGRSSDPEPAPEPESRALTFPAAEELLASAPGIELLGLMPNSSNYTFLARVDPGDGDTVLAVYKPAEGETPLWDFPSGSLNRREVAAYRLSRFLGWPLIPPTVLREAGPHGPGSLQLFIETAPDKDYFELAHRRPAELLPIALFDVVANNADRKAGHHLVDGRDLVWVIDHGLTFHVEPKLRTITWDFAGASVPVELRPSLERAADALGRDGELAAQLAGLLRRAELDMLRRRVAATLAAGWTFPAPTSGWSIPWPPV